MKRLTTTAAGLLMAMSSTAFAQPRYYPPPPPPPPHHNSNAANNAAAALAAVAIGGVIAAAIAKNREQHPYQPYGYGAAPYPPPTENISFSPAPGIMCYGAQRACFSGMVYSPDWSSRVFQY